MSQSLFAFHIQHITALFLFVAEIMLSCRSIGQRVDEANFKCVPKLINFSGFSTMLWQEN